ncbi:hypothetical protein H7J86_01600 [Mycobacterium hackensackense]|uniref:hypothetical protein n=1 Tax=Mycobacterium hackensackense TaxID=228909 RepID=UPI002265F382|nr:hypothetical protein [Mycobacterium hackensackense]MCV7250850.1 hypothetical protein [Mycobacterium hackensackense]
MAVHPLAEAVHPYLPLRAGVPPIEHDLDMIANADYMVDIGPGGGAAGGTIVETGAPEQIVVPLHTLGIVLTSLLDDVLNHSSVAVGSRIPDTTDNHSPILRCNSLTFSMWLLIQNNSKPPRKVHEQ